MGKTVTPGSWGAHPCRGSCCQKKGEAAPETLLSAVGRSGKCDEDSAGEGMPGVPEQLLCNVDTHLYTNHRKAPE